MINATSKTALTVTALCALMVTAPLTQAQPDDHGSPPDGKTAGPPRWPTLDPQIRQLAET
ncbi:hypothetical protein NONI108955_14120 [Nocardia ninae]|uniref:Uncharacterized protein n=1 Tax=Nocardia ninae NBRC 108245 TaxID=1210091 RepID=A0A511M5Z7_9NOCA|nr:hypothetical protein [Nocardia ninae]GEM35568.1 hypothetical protein NN4_00870 [Nocardia ninae NBRC 108245]